MLSALVPCVGGIDFKISTDWMQNEVTEIPIKSLHGLDYKASTLWFSDTHTISMLYIYFVRENSSQMLQVQMVIEKPEVGNQCRQATCH